MSHPEVNFHNKLVALYNRYKRAFSRQLSVREAEHVVQDHGADLLTLLEEHSADMCKRGLTKPK